MAFLFEDITAEITLTRRFRAETDLMQSILDKLADAIAVFSDDGSLAITNYAYQVLWGDSGEVGFEPATVLEITRQWQEHCTATPILGEIREFVTARENRAEWSAELILKSGGSLNCTVSPMQNGATIVRFASDNPVRNITEIQKISVTLPPY